MAQRTTVLIDSRRYVVVWDDRGVIRLEYKNAVSGMRPLLMGSRKAKAVLKRFVEHRKLINASK